MSVQEFCTNTNNEVKRDSLLFYFIKLVGNAAGLLVQFSNSLFSY